MLSELIILIIIILSQLKRKIKTFKKIKKNKNFFEYKIDIKSNKLNKIFQNHKIDIVVHLAAQAGIRYTLKNPNLTLIAIYTVFLIFLKT